MATTHPSTRRRAGHSCQRCSCAWSDSRWGVIDAELAKGDHGGFDIPTLLGSLAVVAVAALALGWLL